MTSRVVRVARDSASLIVQLGDGEFATVLSSGQRVKSASSLSELVAGGSWRRAVRADQQRFTDALTVLSGNVVVAAVESPAPAPRTFRVPPTVRRSIASALDSYSSLLSDSDREIATRLATQTSVSREDIEWMHKFYANVEKALALHGGKRGQTWAAKTLEVGISPVVASAFEYDDSLVYFGIGEDPESTDVNALFAVDYAAEDEDLGSDDVYQWVPGQGFKLVDGDLETLDFPLVVELDEATARTLADHLDANAANIQLPGEEADGFIDGPQVTYNVAPLTLSDIDPLERNLFALAEAEMDWEHIDRLASIVADATGYSPVERSQNAQRQPRATGGRFGGAPEPVGKKVQVVAKARLPEGLTPVEDVNKTIDDYLAANRGETKTEAPAPVEDEDKPVTAAGIPEGSPDPLYLAIVDPVDQTAVLDVVALVPDATGDEADAYVRNDGEWAPSPETVEDLRSATPPVVVKLEEEELVKQVLTQIDEHDGETVEDVAEVDAQGPPDGTIAASAFEFLSAKSRNERTAAGKKGFALPDGSFPIENEADLKRAIKAFGRAKDKDAARRHIKKRARALNRTDLIPEEWSSANLRELFDDSHLSPLYGPHGEIIASVVAAGVPGISDTPSDQAAVNRLERYWTVGEGAAKINWPLEEGNLTRCHRHLSKYVGPDRAWGLCQHYMKIATGHYNPESGK